MTSTLEDLERLAASDLARDFHALAVKDTTWASFLQLGPSERHATLSSNVTIEDAERTRILIALRKTEQARLLLAYVRGERSIADLGLTQEQLDAMLAKRRPLAFDTDAQFMDFVDDVSRAVPFPGTLRIIGTSTSLFSLNSDKSINHYFDDTPEVPSDLDVGFESVALSSWLVSAGVLPMASKLSPEGAFKSADICIALPQLGVLLTEWSDRLRKPGGPPRSINYGVPAYGHAFQFAAPTDFAMPIPPLGRRPSGP